MLQIQSFILNKLSQNKLSHHKVCSFFFLRECCDNSLEYLLNATRKMPKHVSHTIALKNHRQKLKEKGVKYVPGTVNLQVLGSGAHGAPRSLYVFTDQSRYLFNCGEGSQRLAHEHKMKLSKLEHIFITVPTWENIGGLPGVSLTIQDVGVPQITIHGPPGTDEIYAATRRFVVLRHLTIKMATCNKETMFEDNVMKVQYVPLLTATAKEWLSTPHSSRSPVRSPDNSEDSADDDVDYYDYWNNRSRSASPNTSPSHSPSGYKKRRHLSPNLRETLVDHPPPGSVSMAYICRLNDRPGTLNLPACVAQGIRPGPLLGKLKMGEDVTLPDGRVVLSKDVTSPDEPGAVFIIVECPNEEFLDSLLEEEQFKKHQIGIKNDNDMAYLVVHFSPPHIMENPRYQEWMGEFAPSTHHLVLNSSNQCMGSIAVHRVQHKLHMLSPEMFPLLADNGILSNERNGHTEVLEANGVTEIRKMFSVIRGRTLDNIPLRPQKIIDRTPKLLLEPEVYRQETMVEEGFPEALVALHQQLAALGDNKQRFPQIVFLGTGSCIPNKTRNTSGILIHFSDNHSIIMDCGEATYGQIVRLYGTTRTEAILRGLRAIYVSHLHADHHIGLVGLLTARLRVCPPTQPLYLLAPKQIRTWLKTYDKNFEPILAGLQLIPNGDLLYSKNSLPAATKSEMLNSLDLMDVQTCIVKHCVNAFGVAISHPDGWKLTYSGDTMPCDELIQLGKGSDVLIHEATMEDDLESEARLKMHSTTSQAVTVGRQMNASFTLLTHFSQRYAKVPIFNDSFTSSVGIAFDNMQVSLSDLPKLPLMYPALKLMFAEHYEEMELKAIKRQLQQEREMAKISS